jgi:hypothetical protein
VRTSNILDPIHHELSPLVWDQPASEHPMLKTAHAHWIKTQVYKTLVGGGYTDVEKWLTLVLTGSLTTYQYSADSDVDISLFVDTKVFPEWSRAEMIALMVDKLDGVLLPGTPFPLQDFVVGEGIKPSDLYKPGLRSGYNLDNGKWIVPPERNRAHDVKAQEGGFYAWALQMADKMERLLKFEPDQAIAFWHSIHRKRRLDMAKGKGDFSESNIIYKMLANRNLFPAISQVSGEYIARREAHRGNSDTEDRTSEPLCADAVVPRTTSQSQTPSRPDLDDGRRGTQGIESSHNVGISRPTLPSTDESFSAFDSPVHQSSSVDSARSTDGRTDPPWTFDTSPDIRSSMVASHPGGSSSYRSRHDPSQDDTERISSSSPITSRFRKQSIVPQISQVSGEYIASVPEEPPNLRPQDKPSEHCSNCKMYWKAKGGKGHCWGYGEHVVSADEVCDSWAAEAKASKVGHQGRQLAKFIYDPHANHILIGRMGREEGEHPTHSQLMEHGAQQWLWEDSSQLLFGHVGENGYGEIYGRPRLTSRKGDMNPYQAQYMAQEALRRAVPGATFINPSKLLKPDWELDADPQITYMGDPPVIRSDAPPEKSWNFQAHVDVGQIANRIYEKAIEGAGSTINLHGEVQLPHHKPRKHHKPYHHRHHR